MSNNYYGNWSGSFLQLENKAGLTNKTILNYNPLIIKEEEFLYSKINIKEVNNIYFEINNILIIMSKLIKTTIPIHNFLNNIELKKEDLFIIENNKEFRLIIEKINYIFNKNDLYIYFKKLFSLNIKNNFATFLYFLSNSIEIFRLKAYMDKYNKIEIDLYEKKYTINILSRVGNFKELELKLYGAENDCQSYIDTYALNLFLEHKSEIISFNLFLNRDKLIKIKDSLSFSNMQIIEIFNQLEISKEEKINLEFLFLYSKLKKYFI